MWAPIARLVNCGPRQIVSREPPLEVDQQIRIRAYNLWEQAGRPADPGDQFWDLAFREFYPKNDRWYRRDGNINIAEALGFIKDWVTSLIQLQIAAIGAIGIFVSLKDFPRITLGLSEWVFLGLTTGSFFYSIFSGLMILNALPAAMQRVPANASAQAADVFSIANETPHIILDCLSKHVRWSFLTRSMHEENTSL